MRHWLGIQGPKLLTPAWRFQRISTLRVRGELSLQVRIVNKDLLIQVYRYGLCLLLTVIVELVFPKDGIKKTLLLMSQIWEGLNRWL
jgi:hypothetical protein